MSRLIVTTTTHAPPVTGDLFAGTTFWVAQRCPSRADYIKKITYNGGAVVPLEKQADILIVDHLRKDLPVNGVSYRLIDDSLKDAELKDTESYLCGPRHHEVRDVSSARPARAGRTPYTTQDDLELYRWVKEAESRGTSIKGNELYKQLEQKNPRHTFQSWRDRYLKVLSIRPPSAALINAIPPPSPPTSDPQSAPQNLPRPRNKRHASTGSVSEKPTSSQQKRQRAKSDSPLPPDEHAQSPLVPASARKSSPVDSKSFKLEDFHRLILCAADVQNIPIGRYKEAWGAWAEAYPPQTPEEWRAFFEAKVLPVWEDLDVDQDVRLPQFEEAWKKWKKENGADQPISQWLCFYRSHVLPSFTGPVQTAEGDENRSPVEQTEDGAGIARDAQVVGETSKPVTAEETKDTANAPSVETPAVSSQKDQPRGVAASDQLTRDLAGKGPAEQEHTSSAILGKRSRDDEEEEGTPETAPPLAKKRNLNSNNNSQVPLQTTQESVEQRSPKMTQGTPDVVSQDVIQLSSAVPTSSPSLHNSSQSDFEPAQSEQHTQAAEEGEEPLEEEDQDAEDSGVSEGRIREVLGGLSEKHIEELLGVMRTVPAAPPDEHMDLFETVVMHTVHFFRQIKQADSQAVWDVGDTFQKLGIMGSFFESEEVGDEEVGDEEVEDEEVEAEENDKKAEAAGNKQEEEGTTENDLEGTTKLDISQTDISPTSGQELPPAPPTTQKAIATSQPPPQTQPKQTTQHGPPEKRLESPIPATDPTGTLTSDEALETYVTMREKAPHSYLAIDILNALRSTNANASLSDVVLRHMRAHGGALPEMAGVWTARDDDSLQAGGMAARRAERKHRRERCVARKAFLKDWDVE